MSWIQIFRGVSSRLIACLVRSDVRLACTRGGCLPPFRWWSLLRVSVPIRSAFSRSSESMSQTEWMIWLSSEAFNLMRHVRVRSPPLCHYYVPITLMRTRPRLNLVWTLVAFVDKLNPWNSLEGLANAPRSTCGNLHYAHTMTMTIENTELITRAYHVVST